MTFLGMNTFGSDTTFCTFTALSFLLVENVTRAAKGHRTAIIIEFKILMAILLSVIDKFAIDTTDPKRML